MHGKAVFAVAAVEHNEVNPGLLAMADQPGAYLGVVHAEYALQLMQRNTAHGMMLLPDQQALELIIKGYVTMIYDQSGHAAPLQLTRNRLCPPKVQRCPRALVSPWETQANISPSSSGSSLLVRIS